MGCDIHSFAEVRNKKTNQWEKVGDHFPLGEFERDYYDKEKDEHPFEWRSYGMFGFLADVKNYSHCEPISEPKGIPDDVSNEVRQEYEQWEGDSHSASHLTLKELVEFDYSKTFWNRRIRRTTVMPDGSKFMDGTALAKEGEGKVISYKELLGDHFFQHLEALKELGEPESVRIVFWFDN